jgi:hypothetical protein
MKPTRNYYHVLDVLAKRGWIRASETEVVESQDYTKHRPAFHILGSATECPQFVLAVYPAGFKLADLPEGHAVGFVSIAAGRIGPFNPVHGVGSQPIRSQTFRFDLVNHKKTDLAMA